MSDVQNTTLTAEKPAEDSAITSPQSVETAATSAPAEDGPIGESIQSEISPVEPATEAMPAGETTTAAATEPKATEPVSEGQLGYKAPGLVKSLIFSKHEFWLSDEPVSAQHMDHYMRGEHPEVSHPIVGWASQTGKGLLFFNKKGITDKTHPQGVLPLVSHPACRIMYAADKNPSTRRPILRRSRRTSSPSSLAASATPLRLPMMRSVMVGTRKLRSQWRWARRPWRLLAVAKDTRTP